MAVIRHRATVRLPIGEEKNLGGHKIEDDSYVQTRDGAAG